MSATTAAVRPLPSAARWARLNLFNTWYNSVLTVALVIPLAWAAFRLLRFVFVTSRWGAVRANLTTAMAGLYPREELWREWVAFALTMATVGLVIGAARRTLRPSETAPRSSSPAAQRIRTFVGRWWPLLLVVVALLAFSGSPVTVALTAACLAALGVGFALGARLPRRAATLAPLWALVGIVAVIGVLVGPGHLELSDLGGLTLTLFLAAAAIVFSFPIGVLAALGRRSTLPVIRWVSIVYIELIRGVPLITLLFLGQTALQFFVPRSAVPGQVTRAIIMLTLFTGAYVAEIVRGGLQSVPRGQVEAGMALGLSPIAVVRRIVLPQALRNVIPALVGQFISIFKDTSLVAIIGLTDLLLVFQRLIPNQPSFIGQGLLPELLGFAAFVYWAFAYTMSRESQRLERRLGVGER